MIPLPANHAVKILLTTAGLGTNDLELERKKKIQTDQSMVDIFMHAIISFKFGFLERSLRQSHFQKHLLTFVVFAIT